MIPAMTSHRKITLTLLVSVLLISSAALYGSEIRVVDQDGNPVQGVVVYGEGSVSRLKTNAVMDQIDRRFVPNVLAVTVGTRVEFPNNDAISHHVYSFSPAKRFELPLYQGTTAEPVEFDKSGVVTLGCNIHDTMVGYIVVLETDNFGVTDANGLVSLHVKVGTHALRLWHSDMETDVETQTVSIVPDAVATLRIEMKEGETTETTPLEDRFKRFGNGS